MHSSYKPHSPKGSGSQTSWCGSVLKQLGVKEPTDTAQGGIRTGEGMPLPPPGPPPGAIAHCFHGHDLCVLLVLCPRHPEVPWCFSPMFPFQESFSKKLLRMWGKPYAVISILAVSNNTESGTNGLSGPKKVIQ